MRPEAPAQRGPTDDVRAYWQAVREHIDAELMQRIPVLFDGCSADLHHAVQRSTGDGKRLRGCLVCLTCEALGGRIDDAIPLALAVEFVQAASLLHDDVVDADFVRRNRPAEWTVDGARRAVLLADVMFATAIAQTVALGAREGAVITRAISAMAQGAYEEFRWQERATGNIRCPTDSAQRDPYDTIIACKTGSLFGAAAELGALAAGAPIPLTRQARAFGDRLGEAYQIADDRSDLHGMDGMDRSPPRLPLPLGVIRHFGEAATQEALVAVATRSDPAEGISSLALPTLDQAMGRAVAQRMSQSEEALDAFPPNRFTKLLRELPKLCLRPHPADER